MVRKTHDCPLPLDGNSDAFDRLARVLVDDPENPFKRTI
jgi:hypothetical protein